MSDVPFGNQWLRILQNASSKLRDELWVNAIRTIAIAQLKSEGIEPADDWEEWALDESDAWNSTADERIAEWLDRSMPTDCLLINWLGEYDYFREWDLCWFEKMSFEGDACGAPHDICYDMQLRLCPYPVSEEEVTIEVVEDFFAHWRSRFVNRICDEASRTEKPSV